MKSPRYESQEDLENQEEVAAQFSEKWNCSYHPLSEVKYVWDYAAYDPDTNKVNAIVEVRCRKKRYDTLYMSAHKIMRGQAIASFLGVNAILVVRYPDVTVWRKIGLDEKFDVIMGGRDNNGQNSRGDPLDFEPMCVIKNNDGTWKVLAKR